MPRDTARTKARMRAYIVEYRKRPGYYVGCGQIIDGYPCPERRRAISKACRRCSSRLRVSLAARDGGQFIASPDADRVAYEAALEARRRAQAALPNPYCPNEVPGSLTCEAWEPHKHCSCGLPIAPDEPVRLPDVVSLSFRTGDEPRVVTRCIHEPLDKVGLLRAFARFSATPLGL